MSFFTHEIQSHVQVLSHHLQDNEQFVCWLPGGFCSTCCSQQRQFEVRYWLPCPRITPESEMFAIQYDNKLELSTLWTPGFYFCRRFQESIKNNIFSESIWISNNYRTWSNFVFIYKRLLQFLLSFQVCYVNCLGQPLWDLRDNHETFHIFLS